MKKLFYLLLIAIVFVSCGPTKKIMLATSESEFDFDYLYISPEMNGANAVIKWKTINESGGTYVIERSGDGMVFKTVGKAKCTNGEYIVTDKSPLSGVSYYRIRYNDLRNNSWLSTAVPMKNISSNLNSEKP